MTNQTKWSIDKAHSNISFKVKHLMISYVRGSFTSFDVSSYTTDKDFTKAKIKLTIDAASITTGDNERDEHLKEVDFFDVENYKQITFTSNGIGEQDKDGHYELRGELTMKGITKTIKLQIEIGGIFIDPWGNEKTGFSISGKINRRDWGLSWNKVLESGGLMVSEEVMIACEIEFTNADKKNTTIRLESLAGKNGVQ